MNRTRRVLPARPRRIFAAAVACAAIALAAATPADAQAGCSPTMSTSPTSARAGQAVTVSGSDFYERCDTGTFTPIRGIEIEFVQGSRTTRVATVDAGASGQFEVQATVPSTATPGEARFQAVRAGSIIASTGFLVAATPTPRPATPRPTPRPTPVGAVTTPQPFATPEPTPVPLETPAPVETPIAGIETPIVEETPEATVEATAEPTLEPVGDDDGFPVGALVAALLLAALAAVILVFTYRRREPAPARVGPATAPGAYEDYLDEERRLEAQGALVPVPVPIDDDEDELYEADELLADDEELPLYEDELEAEDELLAEDEDVLYEDEPLSEEELLAEDEDLLAEDDEELLADDDDAGYLDADDDVVDDVDPGERTVVLPSARFEDDVQRVHPIEAGAVELDDGDAVYDEDDLLYEDDLLDEETIPLADDQEDGEDLLAAEEDLLDDDDELLDEDDLLAEDDLLDDEDLLVPEDEDAEADRTVVMPAGARDDDLYEDEEYIPIAPADQGAVLVDEDEDDWVPDEGDEPAQPVQEPRTTSRRTTTPRAPRRKSP